VADHDFSVRSTTLNNELEETQAESLHIQDDITLIGRLSGKLKVINAFLTRVCEPSARVVLASCNLHVRLLPLKYSRLTLPTHLTVRSDVFLGSSCLLTARHSPTTQELNLDKAILLTNVNWIQIVTTISRLCAARLSHANIRQLLPHRATLSLKLP